MSKLASRVRMALEAFFRPVDQPIVTRQLQQYQGPEIARVQVAILVLAGGDVAKVADYVAEANSDYRDVLYWAEYSGMPERRAEFRASYHRIRVHNP